MANGQVNKSDSSYSSNNIEDTVQVVGNRKVKYKKVGFFYKHHLFPWLKEARSVSHGVIIRNESDQILKIHELRLAIKSMTYDTAVITLHRVVGEDSIGSVFFEKAFGANELKKNRIDVSDAELYLPSNGLFFALRPNKQPVGSEMCTIRMTRSSKEEFTFMKLKGRWRSWSMWRIPGQMVLNLCFGLVVEEYKN